MGIRLDWEIEAEREQIFGLSEDPSAAKQRRRIRFQLILTLVIVMIVVMLIVGFIVLRVKWASYQIEQLLRDTVAAEVASLRIGNLNTYVDFQRSDSPEWVQIQRNLFAEYQALIQRNENAMLTGRIVDLEIDHPRARVAVEEIVDGVPYTRLWFYWRYEDDFDGDGQDDGWRHVPPDYTFWGEASSFGGASTTVNYNSVDETFARSIGRRFDEWLGVGCKALQCVIIPRVQIDVLADEGIPEMQWAEDDLWDLVVRSPLVIRARGDLPFAPELQIQAATLLAERLAMRQSDGMIAVDPSDASFLQQNIISWLVGQFILIDTRTHLISSLATNYGEERVGQLLNVMGQNDTIAVLSQVTGASLDQSNVDWRDFLTWRLATEQNHVAEKRLDEFLQLYVLQDPLIRESAEGRFSQQTPLNAVVTLVQPDAPSSDGEPQIMAMVEITDGENVYQEQILFRLVNNNWLRAS